MLFDIIVWLLHSYIIAESKQDYFHVSFYNIAAF